MRPIDVAVRLDRWPPQPWQADAVAALGPTARVVAWLLGGGDGRPPPGDAPALLEADPATASALRSLRPAQAIDLSSLPPPSELLTIAPLGWLTLRDEAGRPPESIGLDAMLRGQRAVVCRLLALTAAGEAVTLEEGALRVRGYDWHGSHMRLLALLAPWPARAIGREPPEGAPRLPFAPIPPRLPSWARLRAAELRNLAREAWALMQDERWAIGVIDAPVGTLLGGVEPGRIRWLEGAEDAFLADPMHAIDDDGASIVLAERFFYRERLGHIVRLTLAADDRKVSAAPALRRPYHLSYPYLLRHDGTLYCLPETWHAGRAQLFRRDEATGQWVEDRVLVDGIAAVDPTLHHDGTRWWLFLTRQDDEPDSKLFLYSAPSLDGPWEPHPRNPVKTDLRSARPAGPLFVAGGQLYRPAQDCTTTYGAAVVINRVLALTPDRFLETPATRLAPDPNGPYPHGLHTIAPAGDVTLIDGKRHAFSLAALQGLLQAAWRRRASLLGGSTARAL